MSSAASSSSHDVVNKLWKVLRGAEAHVQEQFPELKHGQAIRRSRRS